MVVPRQRRLPFSLLLALQVLYGVSLSAVHGRNDMRGSGACCFFEGGRGTCADHSPQQCPFIGQCESETACTGYCSSQAVATWCPQATPGPPLNPGPPSPNPIPSIPVPPNACFGKSLDVAAGHDMSGWVVVITGGDTGIGLATSEALASVRATVVIAAYDVKHGTATATNLTRQYSNPNIDALQVRARARMCFPTLLV